MTRWSVASQRGSQPARLGTVDASDQREAYRLAAANFAKAPRRHERELSRSSVEHLRHAMAIATQRARTSTLILP